MTQIATPAAGEERVARVGDTMLERATLRFVRRLTFLQSTGFQSRRKSGAKSIMIRVPEGAVFANDRLLDGERGYCGPAFWDTTIFQQGSFTDTQVCVRLRNGRMFDQWGDPLEVDGKIVTPSFRTGEAPLDGPGQLVKTLRYAGLRNGRPVLEYRERSGDPARAERNEVFRLGGLGGASVLSARIEILEADAERIRYRVLRNFLLAR